jgi:hypothetical protein
MTFQIFSSVFISVSDVCFKCFIYLQTYVTNILFGCFKNKSGVAAGDPPAVATYYSGWGAGEQA